MVKAVLFDADGVLIDACELHFIALNRALETMGWQISRKEHNAIYNGLPTHQKLLHLTKRKGFPEDWHEKVHELKQQYTLLAIDECLGYAPEKVELLVRVKSLGLKIAVCSNSLHKSLERMLQATGLIDHIDLMLGNDDVEAPKPSPQIYLVAAKRLGVSIRECIIVEDSPFGLKAAQDAAPLQVIQVHGPEEVNISLLSKIERFVIPAREVA